MGSSPSRCGSPARSHSAAQARAAARWNCCVVRRRRVYRVMTAVPAPRVAELQAAEEDRERCEKQVRLGLSTTRREPQQVDDISIWSVHGANRWQGEQGERELEWVPPRPGPRVVVRNSRVTFSKGDTRRCHRLRPVHLDEHRPVRESEGLAGYRITSDEVDARPHPIGGRLHLGQDPLPGAFQGGGIVATRLKLPDPRGVSVDQAGGAVAEPLRIELRAAEPIQIQDIERGVATWGEARHLCHGNELGPNDARRVAIGSPRRRAAVADPEHPLLAEREEQLLLLIVSAQELKPWVLGDSATDRLAGKSYLVQAVSCARPAFAGRLAPVAEGHAHQSTRPERSHMQAQGRTATEHDRLVVSHH